MVIREALLERTCSTRQNSTTANPAITTSADATHPQRNSVPSYGWIKKGQKKELKANCGRQRLNINGAINIETLEPTVRFYDTINAQSAMDLFAKIEAKHPMAKVICVIVDNARWYRSR